MSVNTKVNGELVKSAGLYKVTTPIGYGDCYSTEEQEVGCWIDGKPVYQITYIITALPSTAGNTIYSTGITGVENVWLKTCIVGNSSGLNIRSDQDSYNSFRTASISFRPVITDGEIKIHCFNGQDRHTTSANVTVQYTKSTDTAGSGMYLPNGDKAVHYSTDEQVIGTWVDGSTLYRKTLSIPITEKTTDYSVSSMSIDKMINLYGATSSGTHLPFATVHSAGALAYAIGLNYANNLIQIRFGDSKAIETPCYVVCEYTKSS